MRDRADRSASYFCIMWLIATMFAVGFGAKACSLGEQYRTLRETINNGRTEIVRLERAVYELERVCKRGDER